MSRGCSSITIDNRLSTVRVVFGDVSVVGRDFHITCLNYVTGVHCATANSVDNERFETRNVTLPDATFY